MLAGEKLRIHFWLDLLHDEWVSKDVDDGAPHAVALRAGVVSDSPSSPAYIPIVKGRPTKNSPRDSISEPSRGELVGVVVG